MLSDFLFIDTLHLDDVLTVEDRRDAFRILHLDRMRITKRQDEFASLLSGSVTNTVDLQNLLIALSHADYHVLDQCSRETVQRLDSLQVVGSCDNNLAAFLLDLKLSGQHSLQRTLRTFYSHKIIFCDCDSDACRNRDRHSSNS